MSDIDVMSVNAIRALAADTVQKANSGHPGLPLGAAPMAYELWANFMKNEFFKKRLSFSPERMYIIRMNTFPKNWSNKL